LVWHLLRKISSSIIGSIPLIFVVEVVKFNLSLPRELILHSDSVTSISCASSLN